MIRSVTTKGAIEMPKHRRDGLPDTFYQRLDIVHFRIATIDGMAGDHKNALMMVIGFHRQIINPITL